MFVIPSTFSKIFQYAETTVFLFSNIVNLIEKGENPMGLLFDLTKMFECVERNPLIKTSILLNWIETFIRNRKHYVHILSKPN